MKLGSLLSRNRYKIKPKSSKRLAGGCYGRRTKPGGMTTAKRGVVSAPRGWFAVVRKKFLVTPHNKNIIIIHNNTSIASNDEDNRASSCIDPTKDHQMVKSKDDRNKKPGDGDVGQEKESTTTTATAVDVVDLKEDGSSSDGVVEDKSSATTTTTVTTDENKTRDDDDDDDVNVDTLTLGDKKNEEQKAIRIQAAFRGHLARRAFRALKSLVKLQAVVRGVVVRSQARMALHCMRALVRLGDRVRARQLLTRSTHE